MKKVMRVLLAGLAFAAFTAAPVFAEEGATIFLRKGCTSCHGADGAGGPGNYYPKLAGQQKDYVVAQLQAFQKIERNSARAKEMIPFARSLNAEQIEAVATFLASK